MPSRREFDTYFTPPWQVDALCHFVPSISGVIWEPCAGDLSLVTQLLIAAPKVELVVTNDLNPECQTDYHEDATGRHAWEHMREAQGQSPDWVVTNPPFKQALPILKLALEFAQVGVALLSRISFVEPTRVRGPWFIDHPHDQRIVLERWSYTGDGRSDAATTEWLIYARDWRVLTPPFGVSAYGFKP